MKVTIKCMIVAATLVIGAQAQAAGFAAMNGAGLPAGGAVRTCMGSNGHPSAGDAADKASCKLEGKDVLRPMPRYSAL